MASPRGFDNRRFAPLAPGAPGVMIRAHMSRIAEENLCFFPLRNGFDLRVFLLEPLPHQSLVAFLRSVQRLLAGDAELRQQPPDALNVTPHLDLISVATISRVHSANANLSCNGFFCVTTS